MAVKTSDLPLEERFAKLEWRYQRLKWLVIVIGFALIAVCIALFVRLGLLLAPVPSMRLDHDAVMMQEEQGTVRIAFTFPHNLGTAMQFQNSFGEDTMLLAASSIYGHPNLIMKDPWLNPGSGDSAYSPNRRIRLGVDKRLNGGLTLYDSRGRPRLRMRVTGEGVPELVAFDERGNLVWEAPVGGRAPLPESSNDR